MKIVFHEKEEDCNCDEGHEDLNIANLPLPLHLLEFLYEQFLRGILTKEEEEDLMNQAFKAMAEAKAEAKIKDFDSECKEDGNYYRLNLKEGKSVPLGENEMSSVSYRTLIAVALSRKYDQVAQI